MSGFAWLGVLISSTVTTLALVSWFIMAVPYFDNAPYLTDLKKHTGRSLLVGGGLFICFFTVFYLGAQFLDEDTSWPLLAGAGLIVTLPFSLLIGSETWERRNPKGMNRVPGVTSVIIATGIVVAELAGSSLLSLLLLNLS